MLQRTLPAGFIAPCLPTKTDKLPSGDLWLHEIKHDGFRVIARDRFPIDDARARAQARQSLDDQRETIREIIAGTAVEPHLCARLAGDDPKAIVLDLMQPLAA